MDAARPYLDEQYASTDVAFVGKADNPRDMFYALRSLSFKDNKKIYCSIGIYASGIRFVVETHANFQGVIYFKTSFFNSYDLRTDAIDFRVGLHDLLAALNCINTRSASIQLTLVQNEKHGSSKFLINLLDNKIKACVALPIYNNVTVLNFALDDNDILVKFIVGGKTIKEVFREIDEKNNPSVLFTFTQDHCEITTNRETLETITSFPRHSMDVFGLDVDQDLVQYNYKSSFIKRMKYAVQNSEKISLRINPDGHLNVHYYLSKVEKGNIFGEFFMTALDDDTVSFANDNAAGAV